MNNFFIVVCERVFFECQISQPLMAIMIYNTGQTIPNISLGGDRGERFNVLYHVSTLFRVNKPMTELIEIKPTIQQIKAKDCLPVLFTELFLITIG